MHAFMSVCACYIFASVYKCAHAHLCVKVQNLPFSISVYSMHISLCTQHHGSLPRAAEISTCLNRQDVTLNAPHVFEHIWPFLRNRVTQDDDEGKHIHPSTVMKRYVYTQYNTKTVFVTECHLEQQ